MKQSAWKTRMLAKYGSEEAISAQMSKWGKTHTRTDYSTNYLKKLSQDNPEKLSKIQSERAKKDRK